MISEDTRNAISSPAWADGPSQPDLLDGLTPAPSGRPRARASRSARPVKAPERMIQGICGRTYIESSAEPENGALDLIASWENRLAARLAMVGSTESALIWRRKVSPAGHAIFRLAPSTRHTNGTGSIGARWPTAMARDHFPPHTPEYIAKHKANGHGMSNLNDYLAMAYMPTPTSLSGGSATSNPPGNCRSMNAMLEAVYGPDRGMAGSGPTPNGSPATTDRRGAPNPAFASWLMGWSDELTGGVSRATESFSRSRRKFSRR